MFQSLVFKLKNYTHVYLKTKRKYLFYVLRTVGTFSFLEKLNFKDVFVKEGFCSCQHDVLYCVFIFEFFQVYPLLRTKLSQFFMFVDKYSNLCVSGKIRR